MEIINTKNVLVKENISFPYHSVPPLFRQATSPPYILVFFMNPAPLPLNIGFFSNPMPTIGRSD